jgi:hypothetical protein
LKPLTVNLSQSFAETNLHKRIDGVDKTPSEMIAYQLDGYGLF